MTSTRERKERFIKSFGDRAVRSAIDTMVDRYGLGWLNDEQIGEVTSEMAEDAMRTTKHTVRNRRIYRRDQAIVQSQATEEVA